MINNIYCIGRNYAEHAKELGNNIEDNPVVFSKPNTSLIESNNILLPTFSNEIHYETEIVLKISKKCYKINESFSHEYFEDIGIGLDLTARDLQSELKNKKLPWLLSKGFKGSCYISDFINKKNLPKDISFELILNNITVQSGNTKDMIFNFNRIISFISKFIELSPGEVIFTGTPSGVGKLKPKDNLKLLIEGKKLSELNVI